MTWRYAAVRKTKGLHYENTIGIYEYYELDSGKFLTEDPVSLYVEDEEGVEGLKIVLKAMLNDLENYPVIEGDIDDKQD